ncbi:MAG: tRNA (adenosine(37)-N6)-threonylcarbamoyltransferase complex ATPase subunit type 1 TsaE [Patescibacteria group bacterium]|jgi:tRNA threonylcarbamoyladenosine biosynthesis protein TsaE
MSIKKILTKSEKQTHSLGKKLAKQLRGGEVLALTGQLGAGKTVLVKGIAAGLGIKKIITSPTFVLMKVYHLQPTTYNLPPTQLVHIDCYRTSSQQEIADIGAAEYFGRKDTITVIEWAEKIKKILPSQKIEIEIRLKRQNTREITIK